MNKLFTSPREIITSPLRDQELAWALTKRGVAGRYRGSVLGLYNVYLAVAIVFSWLGFFCFQKSRKGFADVL